MFSIGHAIRMVVQEGTDFMAIKRSLEIHCGAREPWYGLTLADCGIRQNGEIFRFSITGNPRLNTKDILQDGRILRIEIWRGRNADSVHIHPEHVQKNQILFEKPEERQPAA